MSDRYRWSHEWHRGRSWSGTVIEDTCPCPKEPCGLVSQPVAECKEHWWERAKTIRQAHAPEDCPAALVVRRLPRGVSGPSDEAVDAAARAIYEATDPKWTAVWTWDKLHDQDDWRRLARAALAAALPIERAAVAEEIAQAIEAVPSSSVQGRIRQMTDAGIARRMEGT